MSEPPSAGTFQLPVRGEKQYLQVGVVDRERWAEETLDNGHHCLCHILLQGQIGMATVCGSVAHLKYKKETEEIFRTSSSSHHTSVNAQEQILHMSEPQCITASLEKYQTCVVFQSDGALHWTCPPGSCQRASRYGWRCRSPSFPPLCPRSSDSQSSHRPF